MKRVSVQAYLSRLAAGAAMIAYPASAWAQASTAAQSDQAAERSVGVEDIVVTAQRRSESVQKVPISIQVLTSETQARANVHDVRAISLLAPTGNFSKASKS